MMPKDKLKILIVISQPKSGLIIAEQPGDANRLGVLGETDPDLETVVEALEKLIEMNLIEIDTLNTPTIANFLDKLKAFQPHIVHFLGHGCVDKEGQGHIALLQPDEQSAASCNFDTIAEYLRETKPLPRLVFLHMTRRVAATIDEFAVFCELLAQPDNHIKGRYANSRT